MKFQVVALMVAWPLAAAEHSAFAACTNPSVACDIGVPGDFDGDGDVDGDDFTTFKNCALGAAVPQGSPTCAGTDFDGDGDTDQTDFGAWQMLYSGSCDCGPNLKEPPRLALGDPFDGWGAGLISVKPDPWKSGRWQPASVHAFSGEFYLQAADFESNGGWGSNGGWPSNGGWFKSRWGDYSSFWSRTYRSRIGSNTAMGKGWDFSYNIRIEAAGPHIRLFDGTGRSDVYVLQNDGTWARKEYFRVLNRNNDGTYTLTFAHNDKWNFKALNDASAAGKIASSVDRNGNTITLTYNTGGRLTKVTNWYNRAMTVAYNADGFISTVTDFTGRQVQYAYYQDDDAGGSPGDLKSVTSPAVTGTPNSNDFSNGKTTVYTYTKGFADERLNHNLLTITDPKGQIFLSVLYSATPDAGQTFTFDRVTRWTEVQNNDYDFTYKKVTPAAGNHFATMKATVNDAVGNVGEYFYDARNRLVIARAYTGRADPHQPTDIDASVNPPTNPLRPNDPPYFETLYEYNSDSLPSRIDWPNLNGRQFTYDSSNGSPRSRGNLLQRIQLRGPLGGDQTQLIETFTYDPSTNFMTRWVDNRGNESVNAYDSRGNLIHVRHRVPSSVEDFEYNSIGQMTAHLWPDNGSSHRRRDEYNYYSSGPQLGNLQNEIVDAGGLALTTAYEYDALGRLVRQVDPRGHDSLYTYNDLGQVVRETSREVTIGGGVRYQRDFSYDANDQLIQIDTQNIDDQGVLQPNVAFSTRYEYDAFNRLIRTRREIDPSRDAVTEFTYDANGNLTQVRTPEAVSGNQPNNTVGYVYDERNLLFKMVRAPTDTAHATTQYDYDPNGNVAKSTEGTESNGRMTLYTYDGYNRALTVTDAMGNVRTYHYDANGNRISRRVDGELLDLAGNANNVRLYETTYQYDAMDRRTQRDVAFFEAQQTLIGDGESTTKYVYTDNSQIKQITDDNNHATNYTYDDANRLSIVTDARGNTSTNVYDANSNCIGRTDLDKSDVGNPDQTYALTYAYDNLDRMIHSVDSMNHTHDYTYDSRSNRVLHTDARNNQTRFFYDGLNRVIAIARDMNGDGANTADPDDMVLVQSWDDNSRIVSQRDDNGNPTAYMYDSLNRRVTIHNADDTTKTMAYDVHDNVATMTDPNGSVVTYAYDLLNRVTNKTINRASGVLGTTSETYGYDGLSRIATASNQDSAVTRFYDSLSRVTREIQQILPSGPSRNVVAVYDGVGNLTQLTYPGGRILLWMYDSLNRPTLVRDLPAGPPSLATFLYVGRNRLERSEYTNGTRLDVTYDGDRLPSETRHTLVSTNAILDDRLYNRDPNHNKTFIQAPAGVPPEVHDFTYDPADRLIQSQSNPTPGNISYTLDGICNRTNVVGGPDIGSYFLDPTLSEPADRQMNQYTTAASKQRTYDRNGNLVTSENNQRRFSYDYINQLAEFTDLSASLTVMYKYDCFGRRIEKNAGGAITRFYYAGGNVIEEQNLSNITLATYACVKKCIPTWWGICNFGLPCEGDNDGAPVALNGTTWWPAGTGWLSGEYPPDTNGICISMTRGGQTYFYHDDDLGSAIKMTNASGQIVEQYQYGDFGRPAFFNGSGEPIAASAIGNPYLFRGYRFDSESGNHFMDYVDDCGFAGSRYFDPGAGRFITRNAQLSRCYSNSLGNAFSFNGDNPATDWKSTLPKRDYVVQYRESKLSFVCRLMEEEGIFYFFRHEDGRHTMTIADPRGWLEPNLPAAFVNPVPGLIPPIVFDSLQDRPTPLGTTVDVTRELPSNDRITAAGGGCGVTGLEAAPFILLWWRAHRRVTQIPKRKRGPR